MDDIVNLFVMLYLKSDQPLKNALVNDLENVFLMIKQKDAYIFVDKTFKFNILLYYVFQFKHC